MAGKTWFGEIFTLKVECDCLLDVESKFVHGHGLSDHSKVDTLCHILALGFADPYLDRLIYSNYPRALAASIENVIVAMQLEPWN